MSGNKLHAVYVALDAHQYSRAVKLASALPPDNHLGQALLAHAHIKAGQAEKALLVLHSLLPESQELDHAIQRLGISVAAAAKQPAPTKTAAAKGGKRQKSKRKPANKQPAVATEESSSQGPGLLEQLETPFVLSKGWDEVKDTTKAVITDETTLDTLAVTLQSMRLFATAYLLYSRAASVAPTAHSLGKAYLAGIKVLLAYPQCDVLGAMQVLALQLARTQSHPHATLWAARTALWQLQLSQEQDDAKVQMLPRLAESLASKYSSPEGCLLYIQTLQYQSKHAEIIEFLSSFSGETLTPQQVGELMVESHQTLEDWSGAQRVYENLLNDHPTQWSYWKGLLASAYYQGGWEQAAQVVQSQLEKHPTDKPCRSRQLIKCELAAVRIRGLEEGRNSVESAAATGVAALQDSVVEYGSIFASRVSCAYSDLAPYIELLMETEASLDSLVELARKLQLEGAMDRSKLRSYIFSYQVMYKVSSDNKQLLPDWTELVNEWETSNFSGNTALLDQAQKENQPGDELVLLAVQNILCRESSTAHLLAAASLLEEALEYSPYNPYLKITAIDVYARLNAGARAWQLYQDLGIKHVQLDSCSFVILPVLLDNGLYNEAVALSNWILKWHGSTAWDTGEFTARAMEHGTLSKADEFLVFQRDRMARSVTLLDAKGCIMDCAPLLYHDMQARKKKETLGMEHGIVGGETDQERVVQMIREVHNSFGAPNILKTVDIDAVSDNRDLSILDHQILFRTTVETKEEMLNENTRRGLMHGLLIHMTLCVEVTKGPKKGKVTKPSDVLLKRCASLLEAVEQTSRFLKSTALKPGYTECIEAMLALCRALAAVSAGTQEGEDTLSNREESATKHLESIRLPNVDWSVPSVCRVLPDVLVPFVAMLRMTATTFALYGWGKRKCQTRESAAALAKVAAMLKELVTSMHQEVFGLPDSDEGCKAKEKELVTIAERMCPQSTIQAVCQRTSSAHRMTRQRVMPFLDEVLLDLSSFEEVGNEA